MEQRGQQKRKKRKKSKATYDDTYTSHSVVSLLSAHKQGKFKNALIRQIPYARTDLEEREKKRKRDECGVPSFNNRTKCARLFAFIQADQ